MDERSVGPRRDTPAWWRYGVRSTPVARLARPRHGILTRVDQIILPFRFIPDGEPLPDLSGYRDPIVLHARFESDDRAPSPSAPSAHEPGSVTTLDAAESARLRRIDPPIAAVYPEAWLLGGFAIRTMGLHVLRAIGRRVLSPEIEAPSQARTDGNAGNTPSSATQPRSPDTTAPANVQITPRQV